ncbi:MAG TPA: hypothetical protein VI932_00795 [Bacteroidota bacterium]|nr:hypothetical protein [Bacteroidota bacterium]
MTRSSLAINRLLFLTCFLSLITHTPAVAQAWVPPEAQLSVSLLYSYSDVGNHLFSADVIDAGVNLGKSIDFGDIKAHTMILGFEYGLTSRFAVSGRLPVVVSKYDGLIPDNTSVDDGLFRGSAQDFRFDARYLVLVEPIALTPIVSVVLPSHHYETLGHVAVGNDLREIHVGAYTGTALPFISEELYAEAGIEYAIVEDMELAAATSGDHSTDYATLGVEVGYFFSPYLSINIQGLLKNTYGGFDWLDPMTGTEEGWYSHDRFAAVDFFHLGGSVSYDITDHTTLYFGYSNTVWGQNSHELESIMLGTSWSFWVP